MNFNKFLFFSSTKSAYALSPFSRKKWYNMHNRKNREKNYHRLLLLLLELMLPLASQVLTTF